MKNLYHVTLQIFGQSGTTLENKYYELDAPFFPEDAKVAYLKENPDKVARRELIVVVQFSDQEGNRDKLDWWNKKDAQLEAKRREIETKAAEGRYGEGDEAMKVVSLELKKVRDEEANPQV